QQPAHPAAEGHGRRLPDHDRRPHGRAQQAAHRDRRVLRVLARPRAVLRARLAAVDGHERPRAPRDAQARPRSRAADPSSRAGGGVRMIDTSFWNWDHAWAVLPDMLWAFLRVTLVVTIAASAIAAVLGLAIALVRRTAPRPVAALVTGIINVIRMTPLVVQLLFALYGLLAIGAEVPSIAIAIVVFGIHYATYMADVYRAGIDAVPRGQWEATVALSMSRGRTWRAVVIPQALRATAPALGNYVISMFKETPFVSVIFVHDMVRTAQLYGGEHFRYIEAITLAGLLFLAASYPTSLLIARLEKRLAY